METPLQTTAKKMWDVLIERYESTDYLSQCACLSRLYSKRYKSGTSMGTHINTMRSMWTEVNSKWKDSKKCNQDPSCQECKKPKISDEDFARILLYSVSNTHETLLQSFHGRKDDVGVEEIVRALLEYDERHKHKQRTLSSEVN
jgi:hypothetical protein